MTNLDFSGKIVYSLADIFTMEKPYSKLISGVTFLFVNRFSNFLWHLLRLLECEMVTF